MCLDFASGPAHVLTHLTSPSTVTEKEPETGSTIYELVPCPNQIKVTDPLLERATDDIFRKTRDDNNPGLSCEDQKFLEILDRSIHKNARGNWEMPLPFRNERQTMPNNLDQAMQRLQGLLKTFARKPEMRADYLEFMGKIIDQGHASAIPSKEVPPPPGRSWYLSRTLRLITIQSAPFASYLIPVCVLCKKLRGPHLEQHMANLPLDRTEVCPPFTNVGFDVFGPWAVQTRKTRRGGVNAKRWGLVFTCLSSRAIHIEILEAMDSSAFICALRRFFALQGHAKLLRCDRGTNFVGAKTELDVAASELDENKVGKFVTECGCKWEFNPPHASHFGGVWERQINTIRRVSDALFTELCQSQLTHKLLVTLMAEVVAIVNARPIAALPSDTDDPQPLSPAMLLTMKTRPPGPPPGQFMQTDIYAHRRWRRIQFLAEQFWTRWRREYLQSLQPRQKWMETQQDLCVGDIILVRDESQHRNDWPLGRVLEVLRSDDGRVRKVKLNVVRAGERKTYLRPIKELVTPDRHS